MLISDKAFDVGLGILIILILRMAFANKDELNLAIGFNEELFN